MPKIESDELKVFGLILAIWFIWVFLVVPFVTTDNGFVNLNPVLQYAIYNLGQSMLFILGAAIIMMVFLGEDFAWVDALINGITAQLSYSFIFDMAQPPNYISTTGQVIIENTASGVNIAVDRMWVYLMQTFFPGLQNFIISIPFISYKFSMLYVAVYYVVPVITFFLALVILTRGKFIKWILENLNHG